jgi:glutaredoxin
MTVSNTKSTTSTIKATPVAKVEIEEKRLRDMDNPTLWTIIGLPNCSWTAKAVELLKEHKENVKVVHITPEWQRRLIVEFQCRRSPAIFKGPNYFGSYDALENYYKCNFFSDSEII